MFSGAVGRALGWAVAPVFGAVSLARRARTFHPRGTTYDATVTCDPGVSRSEVRELGDRLAGPALVRFSGALWKHAEDRVDVLGCAVRFGDDQDLLFATIRRPWTMLLSPFTTDVRDYLANDYFAVSPFDAGLGRRVWFRLRPHAAITPAKESSTRAERLASAVAATGVALSLAIADGPFGPWTPFATIALDAPAEVDDEALRFRPFRTGRGVRPRGFVHALRRGVYRVSQAARP